MLVTQEMLPSVVKSLCQKSTLGFDTETYGLKVTDKLFSIILSDGTREGTYYFNYHDYDGQYSEFTLPRGTIGDLQPVFENRLIIAHNAKFDLHRLINEGIEPRCDFYCTQIGARIEHNTHMSYTLDACGKRIGVEKDDAVEYFISRRSNKAYTMKVIPGKVTK